MLTATEQFSPAARDPQVREFSAAVREMQSGLAKMTAGERVAQAGFTSIEDTAIPVFDALGQARMSFGKQNDGTFSLVYVDGPPPPKPNAPIVSAREGGVAVAIDGTFAGGYVRPADVARFDIHMSRTSGFTADGTTVVGDVAEAGVRVIGAANVTQYVKVVAVSRAKDSKTGGLIASPATDEIAVLPLPISQIAAGAVGTQQLAADFAWFSRAVIGNINAGHLELEGRAGMAPGLFAYDNGLNPTFGLDGLTGNVTMRGTLRSADSGERLIWREYSWANDIRAYPATGTNCASLYTRTVTMNAVDYGAISFFGAQYGNRRSIVWVGPDVTNIFRGNPGGGTLYSGFTADDSGTNLQFADSAGTVRATVGANNNGPWMSWGPSGRTGVYCSDGNVYLKAAPGGYVDIYPDYVNFLFGSGRFQFSYSSAPVISTSTTNCAIQFNNTGIDIYKFNGGAYLAVGASAFVTQSARDTKTEIEDLPFDPERVIVSAPVTTWERRAEQRDGRGRFRHAEKYVGPMADDLPDLLRVTVGGEPGLDLGRNLGVVWAATAQQTTRLDALEARLDALEAA